MALNLTQMSEKVRRMLELKSSQTEEGALAEGTGSRQEEGGGRPLLISPALIQAAWQSLKSGFRGKGGASAMWGAIGILMMQGRVEGDAGRSPMEGDWVHGVGSQGDGDQAQVQAEGAPRVNTRRGDPTGGIFGFGGSNTVEQSGSRD